MNLLGNQFRVKQLPGLALACYACSLLFFSAHTGSAAEAAEKPNFVLCMSDDQGWGDVGYNGNKVVQTPVLDDMAATALRLDRFYAAAPVCSPTRGSFMTGRHPVRFGCFSWGRTLRPQEITMAEAVKTAGYTTGHFGKWHLGAVNADNPVSPGNSGFDVWYSSPNFYENNPKFSHNGKVIRTEGESSQATMALALDFIRAAKTNKQPFLAVVWFGNPHTPHKAAPEEGKLYQNLSSNLKPYYAEITGIDRAMGMLRKELKELGISENTLVLFTSDNGSRKPGSTGGLRGQKGSLYEGGIRVPTVIEWPGKITSPRRSSVPCTTSDLYPTVLELAGVKQSNKQPPLDGKSLVPLLDDKLKERKEGIGFWVFPEGGIGTPAAALMSQLEAAQQAGKPEPKVPNRDSWKITKQYSPENRKGHAAWMQGDWKLHARAGGSNGTFQLYDLATDPAEKKDLAKAEPARVEQMAKELEAWQASVVNSLNGNDY